MDAARELLDHACSGGINYGESFDDQDGVHHILTTTRSEFTIDDIEAAVEDEVDIILTQLTAFQVNLDQQVKQQFNV
jgi:hypothetical protein